MKIRLTAKNLLTMSTIEMCQIILKESEIYFTQYNLTATLRQFAASGNCHAVLHLIQ